MSSCVAAEGRDPRYAACRHGGMKLGNKGRRGVGGREGEDMVAGRSGGAGVQGTGFEAEQAPGRCSR